LAELLGDVSVTTAADAEKAFLAYDEVRRPRSQRVVTTSRENASVLCLSSEVVGKDASKLRDSLSKKFNWLWDFDVQQQARTAREIMRDMLE
jgi:salicylate hydroxylase